MTAPSPEGWSPASPPAPTAHLTSGHDHPTSNPGLGERLRAAAALLPPILGGAPSQPLDLGRTTRVVTAAQRSARAVRDGGCVFPDCQQPLA